MKLNRTIMDFISQNAQGKRQTLTPFTDIRYKRTQSFIPVQLSVPVNNDNLARCFNVSNVIMIPNGENFRQLHRKWIL